jgi:hypothetical protein
MAQDERRGFERVDNFPFMLRHSKHSEPFFSSLVGKISPLDGNDNAQAIRVIRPWHCPTL